MGLKGLLYKRIPTNQQSKNTTSDIKEIVIDRIPELMATDEIMKKLDAIEQRLDNDKEKHFSAHNILSTQLCKNCGNALRVEHAISTSRMMFRHVYYCSRCKLTENLEFEEINNDTVMYTPVDENNGKFIVEKGEPNAI